MAWTRADARGGHPLLPARGARDASGPGGEAPIARGGRPPAGRGSAAGGAPAGARGSTTGPRRAAAGGLALVTVLLAACPAPRPVHRIPPLPLEAAEHHDEPALAGVVHVVRPGETIWRIARAYGIDPADLMETNGIADPTTVPVGTALFVPGADGEVVVPPPGAEPPGGWPSAPAPDPAPRAEIPAPAAPRPGAAGARLAWPLKGVLYGRYGVRAGRRHDGIDIAAPEGAPVHSAAAGTVIFAGEQAGYGAIVIVRHDDGLVTLYAHNSRLLVKEGDRVRRGEPIARVGQTGRTTGPHLHFEVREGTRPKNPLLFLP